MKILYVCHRFPFPPKRGGKIRPFNMIRHLGEQGHEVTVASLARSDEEAAEGAGLADHCHAVIGEQVGRAAAAARMVARLPTTVPSSMGYFYSPALARRIREALARERFDLVFVHCSSVAQYVSHVRDTPKILDFGDMDSQKWLEYAKFHRFPMSTGYWLEGTKLEREEKRLARHFDLCTCTTLAERQTLDAYDTGVATGWFPNGVDAEFFSPDGDGYEPDAICFIGRMDYYPNQQAMFGFCRETLPLIQARRPGVTLTIVGADPSPAVRQLGDLPGVTVTGSVPDVRPYVRRAALSVAPLLIARGTQNKILESMAMGVPVVASQCAANGVDAVAGEHILVGDTPLEVCDAVVSVLADSGYRDTLATRARERVLTNHSWSSSMKRLDALIEQCVSSVTTAGAPRRPAEQGT